MKPLAHCTFLVSITTGPGDSSSQRLLPSMTFDIGLPTLYFSILFFLSEYLSVHEAGPGHLGVPSLSGSPVLEVACGDAISES